MNSSKKYKVSLLFLTGLFNFFFYPFQFFEDSNIYNQEFYKSYYSMQIGSFKYATLRDLSGKTDFVGIYIVYICFFAGLLWIQRALIKSLLFFRIMAAIQLVIYLAFIFLCDFEILFYTSGLGSSFSNTSSPSDWKDGFCILGLQLYFLSQLIIAAMLLFPKKAYL